MKISNQGKNVFAETKSDQNKGTNTSDSQVKKSIFNEAKKANRKIASQKAKSRLIPEEQFGFDEIEMGNIPGIQKPKNPSAKPTKTSAQKELPEKSPLPSSIEDKKDQKIAEPASKSHEGNSLVSRPPKMQKKDLMILADKILAEGFNLEQKLTNSAKSLQFMDKIRLYKIMAMKISLRFEDEAKKGKDSLKSLKSKIRNILRELKDKQSLDLKKGTKPSEAAKED